MILTNPYSTLLFGMYRRWTEAAIPDVVSLLANSHIPVNMYAVISLANLFSYITISNVQQKQGFFFPPGGKSSNKGYFNFSAEFPNLVCRNLDFLSLQEGKITGKLH